MVSVKDDAARPKSARRDAAWQVGALHALAEAALSSTDARTASSQFLRLVARYLEADVAAVVLPQGDDGVLTVQLVYAPSLPDLEGLALDSKCCLADQIMREGRPLAYPSPDGQAASPPPSECRGLLRACAGVPLRMGGSVVGAAGVARLDERPFTHEEIARLDLISDILALAVARLYSLYSDARAAELGKALRSGSEDLEIILYELRHHLLRMAGSINLLISIGDHLPPDQRNGNLEDLRREALDLADDASSLLKLATMEVGLSALRRDPIDIEALLRAAAEGFQAADATHPIEVDVTSPLPPVLGDSHWVKRAIASLLLNASKHSSDQAPIAVSATATEDRVTVSIRHSGPGIPPDRLRRLLHGVDGHSPDRSEEEPGPGLGLAICRRVVEGCGGRIWAESKPARGGTFFFELPVAPQTD